MQAELLAMAKKSTWEKRAQKVKKEEHLILGGNTGQKKHGVKKKFTGNKPTGEGEGRAEDEPRKRFVVTKDGEDSRGNTGSKTRTSRNERSSDSRGKFGGDRGDRKSGPSDRGSRPGGRSEGGERSGGKGIFKSTNYTITREGGKEGGFKSKGPSRDNKFKKDDRSGAFKGKGSVRDSFRKDDRKKSHSKFLDDQHFDGLEQRGTAPTDDIRLNKYLSMAGVCSRREADTYIEQGLVTVNGVTVTELGTKVKSADDVRYAGERVKAEQLRYVLLNKPKDCITTLSDERGRSTVMGLVKNACRERIFPVGRLDRNTTGLLLLTNDGDMAKKLTHPSHEVRKVYHVITDKNITIGDLKRLESGIELEDGIAKADAALFAGDGSVRNEVGMEIHSGKNHIVRRMFAAMGYEVTKLDRAAFAGLSKKGLPRGRWRMLTEKEVGYLKML